MAAGLRIALALLAALALVAAGCGDDEPISSTGDAAAEDDETKRVVIEAEEGAFNAQRIYEVAAPGVVTIISRFGGAETPSIFGGGGGAGQGSGFVISERGEILTNAHVVTDATRSGPQEGPLNAARQIFVAFADGNQVEAEVIGFDPFADVALLEIDPEGLDLAPLPLGSEDDVEVGEGVAAIGSPFGETQSQSLSVGIVSAQDRSIESLTDFRIDGAIQTDAAINPGNSGGPLLDAAGEVVGINQQIQTSSGGNEGVGFAVPIDLAERSINDLRDDGEATYAYAGVTTTPLYPQLAEELDLPVETGALVQRVEPGSPADEAGLRGGDEEITFQAAPVTVGGDVITKVDGQPVEAASDLPRTVSLADPGEEMTLEIVRDGDTEEVELTLGERPASVDLAG
jgi:S1-C subfamily serine protease